MRTSEIAGAYARSSVARDETSAPVVALGLGEELLSASDLESSRLSINAAPVSRFAEHAGR